MLEGKKPQVSIAD